MAQDRRHKRGGRTTPKGTHGRPTHLRSVPDAHPPLVQDAIDALREDSPFTLLTLASGLIEATTPRPTDEWGGGRNATAARPDPAEAFESFVLSGLPGMTELALAIATLHPDPVLAGRIQSLAGPSAAGRRPAWLSTMGDISIDRALVLSHVLGDGDNIMISWSWPSGAKATMVAYIDFNMGTIVKDAFALPEGWNAVFDLFVTHGDDHSDFDPLDPAVARARIAEAIEAGERVVPPIESESWPASRPMLEWVLRHLPEGGVGFERPEWTEAERQALLDEFVASDEGAVRGLTRTQVRDMAEPLVWFACDYGPGDPLRWSPVSVEIVLADWYPRKVFGIPAKQLIRFDGVLAGFVRFAHKKRSIPAELTLETLESLERWWPVFAESITSPDRGPIGNAISIARIAAGLDPDDFDEELDDEGLDGIDDVDINDTDAVADFLEATLMESAGGRAAYEALDDVPLDDVPFDWSSIPEPLRERTASTLALLDTWAEDLFDVEVRTIARAVLAAVIEADPAVFKRSARVDALAAGILGFLLSRLTGRMPLRSHSGVPWKATTKKALADATGVNASTVSARTGTVRNVMEQIDFGWASWLHSSQRRDLLETKKILDGYRIVDDDDDL